jgi:hypothetical protein
VAYDDCRRAAYGWLRQNIPTLAEHHDDFVQDAWLEVVRHGRAANDVPHALFVKVVRDHVQMFRRALAQRRGALEARQGWGRIGLGK